MNKKEEDFKTRLKIAKEKFNKEFTSESNEGFDRLLKDRDPASGIRDFEWVSDLATKANLTLIEDNAMPANNQLLVWKKPK